MAAFKDNLIKFEGPVMCTNMDPLNWRINVEWVRCVNEGCPETLRTSVKHFHPKNEPNGPLVMWFKENSNGIDGTPGRGDQTSWTG